VIESSTAVMEIELPAGARPSDLRMSVPLVSHLVASARDGFAMPKAAGSCEMDATCQVGSWGPQMNSVARMTFTSGGSTFLCSGTLLADTDASTSIPYFLTANHCIGTQSVASSLTTYWFYRSGSCNGSLGTPVARSGGATLLHHSAATDVSFLRLNLAPPAGATYAGWTVGAPAALFSPVTALHHPAGDMLKISAGSLRAYASCTIDLSCTPVGSPGAASFYEVGWSSGATEGGSSGSAIFDSGKYVVGQLWGGSSNCSNPSGTDIYGRFDVSYNAALNAWLNPASPPQLLTVSKTGGGSGSVVSSPAGINCGGTCSASFPAGSTVTLTATADANAVFIGWTGACNTSGSQCTVTMDAAAAVTAEFDPAIGFFPDITQLPAGWISSGAGWSVVAGTPGGATYEGQYALTSNAMNDGESAILSYSAMFQGGTVMFARRVSSEGGMDALRFYVDGELQGEWSGEVPWALSGFVLAAGPHTLTWAYEKSASGSAGGDAAWIDAVTLPSNTAATATADLAVTQTVSPNPASVGKDFEFTLTVTNNGPFPASGITVADTLPAGATLVWASPECTRSPGAVSCNAATLGVGATRRFKLVLRMSAVGTATNVVNVTGAQDDSVPSNNASSANVPVNATPLANQVVRYRLYSPVTREHHFTTDLNEYTVLGTWVGAWQQEGPVGKMLDNPGVFNGVAAVPYYRLFNPSSAWHHWTTDANEYYVLSQSSVWQGEGVDGYVLPAFTPGAIQLFRLLYPAIAGMHHWTIDANEFSVLTSPARGWLGEGSAEFVIQ
ncbi:MAG TPA: trypsin-like peptidase domain-containing protein, partial [Usitatibacter sp.]|nr:trypsin-like peptidase domain-containing protein [Usitatibacter sp.]